MSNSGLHQNQAWAVGKITGAGAVVFQRGGVLARTGAGVYTFTLDQQCDPAERDVQITPRSGAAAFATFADTSDSVITITTFIQTGVATDTDFSIKVTRCA